MLDLKTTSDMISTASNTLFSTSRYALTHPLQTTSAVLFATTLPSVQAMQALNNHKLCNQWLDRH